MMMVFKRKEVLVSALVLLIGVAAVVNYNYEKNDSEKSVASVEAVNNSENYSVALTDDTTQETPKMMGEAQQVNADVSQEEDYFSLAKLNRESARSKKIEILNQMIDSEADEQTKSAAQEDLLNAAEAADAEAVCENLILAKGFEQAVVFINGNEVTVTVKSQNFDDEAAVKIQEIITSNTKIETKNIKIVAV